MDEKAVFIEALQYGDPQARASYLDQACATDAKLRAQVESLLNKHDRAGSFLAHPAVADLETAFTAGDSRSCEPAERTRDAQTAEEDIALDFLALPAGPDELGRIGPYVVTAVIGRGGMGIVLRAHDPRLNRVVAVKVLAPELAANATARRRFLREGRAAAAVAHPHIVTIYAVDEDRLPYLVMEFVDGLSLQEKIDREGHLQTREVLRIGAQLASGLAAAHAHGVIHRDIKPSNVLLENSVERVRITDFGMARAVDDVDITRPGEVAGTPQYMSPEQAQGHTVDARSDLFNLGCVLYATCTGRSPFRAQTTMAAIRRVCEDTPRPIREVNPDTPEWLIAIIDRLLEKDPAERLQTASEAASILSQCLAHLQDPRSTSLPDTVGVHRRSALRRRRIVAGLVGMVLIAGIAVTEATGVTKLSAIVAWSAPGERSPPTDRSRRVVESETAAVHSATTEGSTWHSWPVGAPPPAIAPFDLTQAQLHQKQWADYLGVPVEYTNSIGMTFRLIPPGEFTMGSSDAERQLALGTLEIGMRAQYHEPKGQVGWIENYLRPLVETEGPAHPVVLTKPYFIGATEVTIAQFAQFVDATGYATTAELDQRGGRVFPHAGNSVRSREFHWRNPGRVPQSSDFPVTQVSYSDALALSRWLSLNEGLQYDVPTEAQWEFACRAGTETPWFFGSDPTAIEDYAWSHMDYQGGSEMIYHPVGQRLPNPFGLFDMYGNVQEGCSDWFGAYSTGTQIDPTGPDANTENPERVIRGGALFEAYDLRSAIRRKGPPEYFENGMGIRLVIVGDLSTLSIQERN